MGESIIEIVKNVKSFIDTHCNAGMKVWKLAKDFGIPIEQLEFWFQALFKMTVQNCITEKLLEKATRYLVEDIFEESSEGGKLQKVSGYAYDLGYKNHTGLCNLIMRNFGKTFSEYRKVVQD